MITSATPLTLDQLPHASFHQLIEGVKSSIADPFVLQIGAMDGVLFDMLNPHLIQGGWRGILVEPLPDMFATLQQTYAAQPELKLINCAISDHEGALTLYRIDPKVIAQGLLPKGALGITTSVAGRGFLANEVDAKRYAPHVIEVQASCCTLQNLLDEHKVDRIDVIVIDAEGADWLIAQQIDFTRYAPRIICLEHSHLTQTEINECFTLMLEQNYVFAICQEDRENMLFYKNQENIRE